MDASLRLLFLSFAMFIGSYLFGAIPLAFSLSERRLKTVSILGAGLIVGTALSVIIPEGVHALYERREEHDEHSHGKRSTEMTATGLAAALPDAAAHSHDSHFHELHAPALELHSMIGVSLAFGFVFMLLVDQFTEAHGHHGHTAPIDDSGGGGGSPRITRHRSIATTLGLIIHAAADGMALGAAATTTRTDVEIIIFVAIMLHKAPAAFGLTTFLLRDNCDRNRIRRHLLAFSVAAPLCALVTFYGLSQSGKQVLTDVNGTGLVMLFSAGTFLYVATMHILPEVMRSAPHQPNLDTGDSTHEHVGLDRRELLLLVSGVVMPTLIGLYHKH